MKLNSNTKAAIFETTCLLYIFLLVYAAMNKALDFEKFKVEMGQSPLLSAFADWMSWLVLIIEFTIVFFLLFPKTRTKALYAGFCLMSMFTAYIFIMLNFSSFLPCSCGGILENMTWKQHFLFNVFFVLIGAWALWLHNDNNNSINRKLGFSYAICLFLSALVSTVIVVVLFFSSEEIMQHQNPFIRRYPHHPATLIDTLDLKYNSYYFAGSGNGNVYLGNLTVPLYLLSIDSLMHQQKIRMTLDKSSFSFKEIKINVNPPFFYLADGRTPAIFKGRVDNWRAELQQTRPPYFTNAIPIDSSAVTFNGISSKTGDNTLGIFRFGNHSKVHMSPELLQKQVDGVFDTEGMLHYSEEMKRIVYLYAYRNQYIVADQSGRLDYRGNTIDTISKAQIKVAYLKDRTERTMSIPALNVNKSSSVCGHLLFVNSNVPGRYEQKEVWEQASVIDVYDLRRKTYLHSFHIYGIGDQKLRSFMVTPTHVYALIGSQLAVYRLGGQIRQEMKLN
ncbi:MauE/DoxX family redox-associated membrane protein [Flavobacterium sp. KACC 22763]|uniref:MauE/DoxX family redox-associated membrane protein n=1 Tax=Flavobacterium sp. KACC 22763 TaxID=3025668 RepID=UPI002366CE01|nr:DoxX family protein [Flavobacterium sp. KACC 22763]WDF66111.1 DoxX family protein [Flavobacterium sp. KACC 22763]